MVQSLRGREVIRALLYPGLEIGNRIAGGRGFTPRDNWECRWCDYIPYCPLKTEAPLEIPTKPVQMELILGV